ncbi:MAG: hypothetical protein ACRDVL_09205 [Acidimicrobiia bacterium]
MAKKTQPPGCRDVALATGLLLSMAAVFMGTGLSLIRGGPCTGACETLSLTLLYAGGPVSALFGVFFGGIVLAWPLDATLWVGTGFLAARIASRRRQGGPLGVALILVLAALGYGLVLSGFVQIAER